MRRVSRKDIVFIVVAAAIATHSASGFSQQLPSAVSSRRRHVPRGWTGRNFPSSSTRSLQSSASDEVGQKQVTKFKTSRNKGSHKNPGSKPNGNHFNTHSRRQGGGGGSSYLNYGAFNQKMISQQNAQDLLSVLASKKGALSSYAGGSTLSTVNFSTAIHRIGKNLSGHLTRDQPGNERGKILSDPRFALLMCSTAEAMLDGAEDLSKEPGKKQFGAREFSNVAWGIAKLNFVPPADVMPVDIDTAEEKLREKAAHVRSTIFEVAMNRASGSSTLPSPTTWIPALSEMCGLIVDVAAVKSLKLDRALFQQQELSNLMWSLTTVKRPTKTVFGFVVDSIVLSAQNTNNRRDQMLKPQEWSIPLYCLAKTGMSSGHEEKLLPFVKYLMDNEPGFLQRFKPQELSNCVWAAATILSNRDEAPEGPASEATLGILRHAAKEMIRRDGEQYTSQELSNTAWSMATLGFGILDDSVGDFKNLANSYTVLSSKDPDGDKVLMQACLEVCKRKMKEKIKVFKSQELNNFCWSMARLDEKDEELIGMIGQELIHPRRKLNPQDLSTTIWSMATMEYFDEGLYQSLVSRIPSIGIHRFKPQEMSNTLWALATGGVVPRYQNAFDFVLLPDLCRPTLEEIEQDPVTNSFRIITEEMMRRLHFYKPQEIKDSLWALTKVGLRHPHLFKFVAEHLVGKGEDPEVRGRGLELFDGQGISNIAYVYARHAQLGAEVLQQFGKKCRLPVTGGRLACYTVSYLDISESLLRKLYSEIARIDLAEKLPMMSSQDISNQAWGFAIQGLKHESLLAAISEVYSQRMKNILNKKMSLSMIKGQEICNTAWAFATLNFTPEHFLTSLEEYLDAIFEGDFTVAKISKIFTRQELSNLGFALAVFGEYPNRLVELIYKGLIGIGDRYDPKYLQKMYNDRGIDQTYVNCLIYLQTLLDLEFGKAGHPFSLPDDFPTAWSDDPTTFSLSSASPDESMVNHALEINTSNTQRSVSAAFDRVGFAHVDEYIYTMADMVELFGIQMASCPLEMLSMDIANVESRIGIELDGPGHFITDIDHREDLLSDVGFYRLNNKGINEYVFSWNSHDQEINGSTALKLRIYSLLGWRVFNIPFWEWATIYNNKKKEDEYCLSVLERIG